MGGASPPAGFFTKRLAEDAHFHARRADVHAKVMIDQAEAEVIESNLDVRHLRLALAWAELHREELLDKLASCSGG